MSQLWIWHVPHSANPTHAKGAQMLHKKIRGLSLRKHQNNSKHQKHIIKKTHLTMEMEITMMEKKQTKLPATTNTHPFPGWCHCRFGYGFGHWTCQFLSFMATRWSKTWTWWYPRCNGRFEAWYGGGVRSMEVNDLGGWGGVGLWGALGGWCTLKFCLWVEMQMCWNERYRADFVGVERHRQIQPGSTCDLGSRYQTWCDFRAFVQLEVSSSWKRSHSNLITYR